MRRDIKAIVAAHKMDSHRRELYVEGGRDRSLFLWFLKGKRDANAMVCEINSVQCDGSGEGGCRGRLLKFAGDIRGHNLQIKCFADADFDRLLARSVPENVCLTDCRDLEWYFLQPDCIDKVLHLALATEKYSPETILREVSRLGRPLGLLRLLSEREKLKLPFQARPPKPYLKSLRSQTRVELNFNAYLQALLQGANIGLSRLAEFKSKFLELQEETKDVPDSELIHGKDCLAILAAILCSEEFKEDAVEPSFWMSLESARVQGFPNLKATLEFLSRTQS